MQRQELIQILLDIDEEIWLQLGEQQPKPRIIIVGGSAFILHDTTSRKITHDIDVFEMDNTVRSILSLYPMVNGNVMAYCDQIPFNFEDRLVVLDIKTKAVEYVTPSIEDLIVMKLYRESENDIEDIDSAITRASVNWRLLEELVYGENEAKASALVERRYKEMTEAFERLKARFGKKNESDL